MVFAVLYWPYNLLICYYSSPTSAVIAPTLYALVYIGVGWFLIKFSKRLAGLVAKGVDRE